MLILRKSLHVSSNVTSQFNVKLTKDVYKVKRGEFATLNDKHLQLFENILSKERVLTDSQDVDNYNVDWIKMLRGMLISYNTYTSLWKWKSIFVVSLIVEYPCGIYMK